MSSATTIWGLGSVLNLKALTRAPIFGSNAGNSDSFLLSALVKVTITLTSTFDNEIASLRLWSLCPLQDTTSVAEPRRPIFVIFLCPGALFTLPVTYLINQRRVLSDGNRRIPFVENTRRATYAALRFARSFLKYSLLLAAEAFCAAAYFMNPSPCRRLRECAGMPPRVLARRSHKPLFHP